MTDNELLLAISNMMDTKLKSTLQAELQPLKDDIKDMKQRIIRSCRKISAANYAGYFFKDVCRKT